MNQKYHLLVVDDQEPIRELVRKMYGEKFFVTTADSLESAVEILNNVTVPDLVLTDLDMQQPLDGIRLLQGTNVMREEPRYRNLETAVMSGRDSNDPAVQQAQELSTSNIFLKKPNGVFQGNDLLFQYLEQRPKQI